MFQTILGELRYWIPIKAKNGNMNSRLLVATLATILVFATNPIFADDVGVEGLIAFQANTQGETFVTYGSGAHEIVPPDDMRYVPDDTMELPADVIDALKEGTIKEIVVLYEIKDDDGMELRAARCHWHNGRLHWHRARAAL